VHVAIASWPLAPLLKDLIRHTKDVSFNYQFWLSESYVCVGIIYRQLKSNFINKFRSVAISLNSLKKAINNGLSTSRI
jgi:hypothetical protein